MAIAAVGIFSLVVALPVTIAVGGFNTFGYIGGIAGLAFILLYISLGVGTIVAFTRRYRQSFNPWIHVVVPVVAIALFCIPLVGMFYPVPAFPYVLFPYLTLAWLAIGIVVAVILTRRRPDLIGRLGRVFLDSAGSSAPEVSPVGSSPPDPGGERI